VCSRQQREQFRTHRIKLDIEMNRRRQRRWNFLVRLGSWRQREHRTKFCNLLVKHCALAYARRERGTHRGRAKRGKLGHRAPYRAGWIARALWSSATRNEKREQRRDPKRTTRRKIKT